MRRKGGRYIAEKKGGPVKRAEFTKPRAEVGEGTKKKSKPQSSPAASQGGTGEDK